MILSVSRRTDIPSYYSDWFYQRIKEGFLYVRNPMNRSQISEINISPEVVDCIVFWTKNPKPMLQRLDELENYKYYFQFTLTGYGKDVETNVPHKKEVMIPIFQKLSTQIGSNRVVWRYDPILFNNRYTPEYHLKAFKQIATSLKGYTNRCIISLVDVYAKNMQNMKSLDTWEMKEADLMLFASSLAKIVKDNGMRIFSCAEIIDMQKCGIEHSSCIDKLHVEEIIGYPIKVKKDKNQRADCGCVESVEVGTYNTCQNGCKYCYANFSEESVRKNCRHYDVNSPLLCGEVTLADKITKRQITSLKIG